jgi:hypothetical protein
MIFKQLKAVIFLNFYTKISINLRIFLIIFCSFSVANAGEVLFAGVGFTGDRAHREQLYPHADRFSKEVNADGFSVLDLALREAMIDFQSDDLKLRYEQDRSVSSGSGLTLAFGLGGESVEFVEFKSEVIVIYRVMARIVVFDWAEDQKKMIASFPLQIVFQDTSATRPTLEQQGEVFRRLYTDTHWDANVFQSLKSKLQKTIIRSRYGAYIGVANVGVNAEALASLQRANVDIDAYKTSVAQTLESVLSYELGVGLVPYTRGEAIGKNMALRFSDARVFNLKLPERDYNVDFNVSNFRHVEKSTTNVKQIYVAAYAHVKVSVNDGADGKYYFNEDIKHINQMAFPVKENVNVDYWSAYQTAMRTLMVRFAKASNEPDMKVIREMSPTKDLSDSFAKFKPIVEKCK